MKANAPVSPSHDHGVTWFLRDQFVVSVAQPIFAIATLVEPRVPGQGGADEGSHRYGVSSRLTSEVLRLGRASNIDDICAGSPVFGHGCQIYRGSWPGFAVPSGTAVSALRLENLSESYPPTSQDGQGSVPSSVLSATMGTRTAAADGVGRMRRLPIEHNGRGPRGGGGGSLSLGDYTEESAVAPSPHTAVR